MKSNLKSAFIYRSFLFCMILFASAIIYAQLNSGNLSQYVKKDGLPDVRVNDVLVDKSGYVLAGTDNVLVRYDGYPFKRFYNNPTDSTSMSGLVVWSLFEDHDGKIWVGRSLSFLNAYNCYQLKAKISARRLNDWVEIRVEDNGNGIQQNITEKIFQPFFTAKPTGQGTDLGLSLAYDIITKKHNGTIKVESKESEGIVLRFN